MTFCNELRKETDIYWEASFKHPFVQGIADGTLALEKFKYYMIQDAYYLKHYAKVLAFAAAKCDTPEEFSYYTDMAKFITEAELELHRSVFLELNVTEDDLAQAEPAPNALNYINHMYSAVHNGDVAEAFAAMMPCPWLYLEIGQYYKDAKPGVKLYQDWIDMYSNDAFQETIQKQIQMMNSYAEKVSPAKLALLKTHFKNSCYYELLFWDMAWTKQNWLSEVAQ
ncbi:MAG: thiaminase II [Lysinibacillus sp.]